MRDSEKKQLTAWRAGLVAGAEEFYESKDELDGYILEVAAGKHDKGLKAALRKAQLDEIGITEDEVFSDEDGDFYWQEPSLMDEGENESGKSKKIYIDLE